MAARIAPWDALPLAPIKCMVACPTFGCLGERAQGDHTIIATPRTVDGDGTGRTRAPAAAATVPARKTPSPKPPSPPLGSFSPRTRTPPPPPMLSSRAGPSAERRSPKTERHSPTHGKSGSSPTEALLGGKPPAKGTGHIRSMSASTTPTPPPTTASGYFMGRQTLAPRSKSQASEAR